ncbi:hypothetical protein [Streptomyces sp. NPDC097619]
MSCRGEVSTATHIRTGWPCWCACVCMALAPDSLVLTPEDDYA